MGTYSTYKEICFSMNFFNALFAMDSLDMVSPRKHPKYSATEDWFDFVFVSSDV